MRMSRRGRRHDPPGRPRHRHRRFAAGLRYDAIPEAVRERARIQILDAVGVGFAANAFPFAAKAMSGIAALDGSGDCSVVGRPERLAPRDAALANGVLMHGLDFDDTHLASIVHASVAALPCALALGEHLDADGETLMAAYVAGMEVAIRMGLAARGGFHHAGFHGTGVISHFSSTVVAARLLGLSAAQLISAQGIAASTASGVQVFLEEGAWDERFHPGWGAVAGITAATLAQHGFVGPTRPYEGKFGLFQSHLQGHLPDADLGQLSAGLGSDWKLAETAIKPYPVCHFAHGAADAAIALHGPGWTWTPSAPSASCCRRRPCPSSPNPSPPRRGRRPNTPPSSAPPSSSPPACGSAISAWPSCGRRR